jgi:hypothetical protein
MDTSKSGEASSDYVGEAVVFSGRKNPTWTVDASVGRQLEKIWSTLEATGEPLPQTSALGYQGCRLRHIGGGCWLAFQGRVERESGGIKETRVDSRREFEKLLLSTAPPGLVPASFLPNDLRVQ